MSLKRQLFVASIMMLLIPWAGLQFVLELDKALRAQASEQLESQASRMAAVASQQLAESAPLSNRIAAIYLQPASGPVKLDGHGDDWPGYEHGEQPWQTTAEAEGKLAWQAATHGRYLYLLVRVERPQPRYFDPGNPGSPHDFLRLRWQTGAAIEERILRTSAPGHVTARLATSTVRQDHRVTGFWRRRPGGYQIELRLPRIEPGARLGLEMVLPAPDHSAIYQAIGTRQQPLPVVTGRNPSLETQFQQMLLPGQQVRLTEPAGWLIAHSIQPLAQNSADFDRLGPTDILERMSLNALRALVRFYQPEPVAFRPDTLPPKAGSRQLVRHPDGDTFLQVTETAGNGRTLVLEQSLDQILALSGNTLGSVIARSALLIVAMMLVLLGYASWLSWRITRLQRAVTSSVDSDGRILSNVPTSRARDELGELNRQFSQMVNRLQGYTDYLESFSRRLSHELKTPVAVIRSSLDNLEHAETSRERASYQERARGAVDRLSQILHGMSEAARLEQSFDHAELETFDLADVLSQATAAYQALDPHHRIHYQGPSQDCPLDGSPELIVQLLDKLVDNARDFTPEGGQILVTLERDASHWQLGVFNEGSSLPDALARDIFNPFVSIRGGSGEGHLGQGLLIVRLITEHHGGQVLARNQHQQLAGVWFEVRLPVAPPSP